MRETMTGSPSSTVMVACTSQPPAPLPQPPVEVDSSPEVSAAGGSTAVETTCPS
jgi:hypothetical protein